MYRIVWQYTVRSEALARFTKAYGKDGVWTEFFRSSPDYITTELYNDVGDALRFITVDVWRSRSSYEQFRKSRADDYAELDTACDTLVARQRTLGVSEDGKE
jgi:heme-degrading monooxygenase HmoA